MQRIRITLPLSLLALGVWLSLTVGVQTMQTDGARSLAESAGDGIGLAWLMAALFAGALAFASTQRCTLGLGLPHPWRSLRILWLPGLYTMLMLLLTWLDGLPPTRLVMFYAANAALVALSEELMFRAVLLRGFLTRYRVLPAVLASSMIFGAAHLGNGALTGDLHAAFLQAGAAALQGICYAAIRVRTQSIWPMVGLHALWDFTLITSATAAAADGEVSTLPAAALVMVLPLALYGLYLLRKPTVDALAGVTDMRG